MTLAVQPRPASPDASPPLKLSVQANTPPPVHRPPPATRFVSLLPYGYKIPFSPTRNPKMSLQNVFGAFAPFTSIKT